jgi:hypothetical protein
MDRTLLGHFPFSEFLHADTQVTLLEEFQPGPAGVAPRGIALLRFRHAREKPGDNASSRIDGLEQIIQAATGGSRRIMKGARAQFVRLAKPVCLDTPDMDARMGKPRKECSADGDLSASRRSGKEGRSVVLAAHLASWARRALSRCTRQQERQNMGFSYLD